MRSYRASNHVNLEAVFKNPIDETTLETHQHDTETEQLLDHHSHTLIHSDVDLHLDSTITHSCLCHLDNNSGHQNPSSNFLADTEKCFSNVMSCDLVKSDQIQSETSHSALYQAHSHNIGPLSYLCHPTSMPLITEPPSSEKNDYSYELYDCKPYPQLQSSCCTSASMRTTLCDRSSRLRVNVVRNPLDWDEGR